MAEPTIAAEVGEFHAAAEYEGARPGFVFQMGPQVSWPTETFRNALSLFSEASTSDTSHTLRVAGTWVLHR